MTRTEILELARSASEGNRKALTRFRELAVAAGFVGGAGGWIRLGDQPGTRNIGQGWAALAKRASQSGWVLEHLVDHATASNLAEADRVIREADALVTELEEKYNLGAETVIPAELDRSVPATFPAVESVAPDARTSVSVPQDLVALAAERTGSAGSVSLAAVAEGIAAQGELPGTWEASDLFGGQADTEDAYGQPGDLGGPLYGMEVLKPVSGVHRVAILDLSQGDKRVQVFHGDTALADATSAMIKYNQGVESPPEPVEPRVHPGDVVTVHRGVRRYEVLRVELDAWKNGERCDYARIVPCAPEDDRDAQWVAMDLLHVVEPVATLNVVEVNGFMVTEELVDLGHHTVTETEAKRVALIPDPAMGGAKTRLVLVDPRFPRGAMPGAEETAERPVMYPGDSVILHRPSGNTVARWMPELDPTESQAILQDVTWVSRTHATS